MSITCDGCARLSHELALYQAKYAPLGERERLALRGIAGAAAVSLSPHDLPPLLRAYDEQLAAALAELARVGQELGGFSTEMAILVRENNELRVQAQESEAGTPDSDDWNDLREHVRLLACENKLLLQREMVATANTENLRADLAGLTRQHAHTTQLMTEARLERGDFADQLRVAQRCAREWESHNRVSKAQLEALRRDHEALDLELVCVALSHAFDDATAARFRAVLHAKHGDSPEARSLHPADLVCEPPAKLAAEQEHLLRDHAGGLVLVGALQTQLLDERARAAAAAHHLAGALRVVERRSAECNRVRSFHEVFRVEASRGLQKRDAMIARLEDELRALKTQCREDLSLAATLIAGRLTPALIS